MKGKLLALLVSFSLVFGAFPTTNAKEILEQDIVSDEIIFSHYGVISATLSDYLLTVSDDELIPVTIRLKDDVNLYEVDALAMEKANVTAEQLQSYESQTNTLASTDGALSKPESLIDVYDRISYERINILKNHYEKLNTDFLANTGLADATYHSVSKLLPYIRNIFLTKSQILQLAGNEQVCYLDYSKDIACSDLASISDTRNIIDGEIAVNNGYTGSGIRVGLVESGHPNLSKMGSDASNITKTNTASDTDHATRTSGIIKSFAPSCSVFSRAATSLQTAIDCCETLIVSHNVHVINISSGAVANGVYDYISMQMDELIQTYKVCIVVAAGNDGSKKYVNQLGIAANAITVGAVHTSGTSPYTSGAFTFASYSSFIEGSSTINKPDICAPGCVSIYSLSEDSGTSYAAPHVTGTIVQMLSRNGTLIEKPNTVKAILMASAYYNGGSDMTYITGSIGSNKEGAGVIDAGFCYTAAANTLFKTLGISSPGTSTVSVYISSPAQPYRIAVAWWVNSSTTNGTTTKTNFDVNIYKNGALVASSTASTKTNYEIICLNPSTIMDHGAGYYEIQVSVSGSFYGPSPNYVGVSYGAAG